MFVGTMRGSFLLSGSTFFPSRYEDCIPLPQRWLCSISKITRFGPIARLANRLNILNRVLTADTHRDDVVKFEVINTHIFTAIMTNATSRQDHVTPFRNCKRIRDTLYNPRTQASIMNLLDEFLVGLGRNTKLRHLHLWFPSLSLLPSLFANANEVKVGTLDYPVRSDLLCWQTTFSDKGKDTPPCHTKFNGGVGCAHHRLPLDGPLQPGCQFCLCNAARILYRDLHSFLAHLHGLKSVAVDEEMSRQTHILDFDNRQSAAWAFLSSHFGVSLLIAILYHSENSMSRGQSGITDARATGGTKAPTPSLQGEMGAKENPTPDTAACLRTHPGASQRHCGFDSDFPAALIGCQCWYCRNGQSWQVPIGEGQ